MTPGGCAWQRSGAGLACPAQWVPASGAGDGADASWGPCSRSKLRTDAKVKDVYKMGKTLGTGGGAPHLAGLVQMQAPFQQSLAGPAWSAASAAAVCVTDILRHCASMSNGSLSGLSYAAGMCAEALKIIESRKCSV